MVDDTKMTTFRKRITELYEESRDRNHRIGRTKFAEILGVTKSQLNGWLDGSGKPDYDTLIQIAARAGVTSAWLIGETDHRNFILPKDNNELPPQAQRDYYLLLDFLKYRYK